MRLRFLTITITFSLLIACMGKGYSFEDSPPPGPDKNTFKSKWYSKQLNALTEPLSIKDGQGSETYRFTWLRTFDHPIAVMVETNSKGEGVAHIEQTDGKGGYDPGKLAVDRRKALDAEAVMALRQKFDECRFLEEPSKIDEFGLDGAQWIIEARDHDRYHVVDRWSPKEGCHRELGLLFLKISELEIEDVY